MKTSSTRRYAETTKVPMAKTRAEIDTLLRKWGCSRIAWADDLDMLRIALQFHWAHDETVYVARFIVQLPDDDELWKMSRSNRRQFEQNKVKRGNVELRQLLLLLKAAFNAVEAGIIKPEQLFLSWLVGCDGRTVGDVMLPRLPEITRGAHTLQLLEAGPSRG